MDGGVCNPTLNAFYSLHYLFIKSCHSLYTSWWVGGTCAWFNKRHVKYGLLLNVEYVKLH